MTSSKFYVFIFVILLSTRFVLANEVLYLLQSVSDTNKVELITSNSKQNVLYIKSACTKCLDNALKLVSTKKYSFLIVVGEKPIENTFEYLKNNKIPKPLWTNFYLDPGFNFINQLKIFDNNSVVIASRNGATKINVNANFANGIPSDTQLALWK